MGKTIAITNHKGGPGKTTISMQILDIASNNEYGLNEKVLGIDADPQGSLTDSLKCTGKPGLYDLLVADKDTRIVLNERFHFISCTGATGIAEALRNQGDALPETCLADLLDDFRDEYDLIVIDCPPENDFINNMAYMSADEVIVPVTSDEYSLKGLITLSKRLKKIKRFNSGVKIGGIVINRVNMQSNAFKDTLASAYEMATVYGTRVYGSIIPTSVTVDDAQKRKMSLMQYAPKSKVAQQFLDLIKEIVD